MTENKTHIVSPLGKTWIFDLDGTILKHNGYKLDGEDSLLGGVEEFFSAMIRKEDTIIFLTSRAESEKSRTERFLLKHGVRFDWIIYGMPYGERILVNDKKPSGLKTAIAVNTVRNQFMEDKFIIDSDI